MLAKFVGPTGKVIAVEASPHNYQAAVRNIRANNAANVEVINAAVSDNADPLEFNCRANGQVDDGSGAWGKIAVPSVSVDELTRRLRRSRRALHRRRGIRIEGAAGRRRYSVPPPPRLLP